MFSEKTAIITGAGSGIGQALAIELANKNCNLALIDTDADNLKNTANMLKSGNIKVSSHIADLCEKSQVIELPQRVFSEHKKAEYLFNIAGVAAGGTFEDLETEIFEKAMKINFFSQVYMMKSFLPYLKNVPKAHVINMSSITGKAAFAKNSAYSATKFAISGFTDCVACELENSNIRFSVIYPGLVCTNISANAISKGGNGDPNDPYMIDQGISPHKAAEIIIKGVRKEKREIFVGKDAKLLSYVHRLLPVKYWNLIKRYVKNSGE